MKVERINKALGPGLAIQVNTVWISVRRISMVPQFSDPAAERVARRILKWVKPGAPTPSRVKFSVSAQAIADETYDTRLPSQRGIQFVNSEAWAGIRS